MWLEAKIEIPATYTRIQLEGVIGKSYKSDIAIDDLAIVRGRCRDYGGL